MIKRTIAAFLSLILIISVLVSCGNTPTENDIPAETEIIEQPEENKSQDITASETPAEPETQPEQKPEPIALSKTSSIYTLTFAGDCTLGAIFESRYEKGFFEDVVGKNYDYPFEYCLPYFKNDDLTMVNLECVLTNSNAAVAKMWRLIGDPDNAKFLTAGDIEVVNLANNHTYDFGVGGYADTKAALESENIKYVEDAGTLLYTTDSGLVIGFYSAQFSISESLMRESIKKLREEGAEIVIFSYHGGIELSYRATREQQQYCRGAIDAGADIVFGHHPHTLQPVEEYNGGVIYYSLGNFAFGGNANPRDKDSAIIQQKIIRDADGSVSLGETVLIPFSITSTPWLNDYRPIPLDEGSEQYIRCMEKLTGTYSGPDLLPNDYPVVDDGEEDGEGTEPPQPPEEGGGEGGGEPPEDGGEGGETPPPEGGGETPPEGSGGETPPPAGGDEPLPEGGAETNPPE